MSVSWTDGQGRAYGATLFRLGLVALTLTILGWGATAFALQAGPNYASTQAACTLDICGNSTGTSNGACSTGVGSAEPDSISLTNFGFTLPNSVTSIDGIKVEPDAAKNECTPTVQLLKGGSPSGSTKTPSFPISTACSQTNFVAAGGVSDLWGTTFTRTEINNGGFGVKITKSTLCDTVTIDSVRISVFFSIATPVCGDGYQTGGEACDDGNTSRGDGCSSECQLEAALNADEQKCVTTVNKDGVGIIKAQTQLNLACIKGIQAGTLTSVEPCATNDSKLQVQKALERATDHAADLCAPTPPFGFVPPGTVASTLRAETKAMLNALYGGTLNSTVIKPKSVNADMAACQLAITDAMYDLALVKANMFLACKKSGLKSTADQQMLSGADLEACFDVLADDEQGKIAKAIAKIDTQLEKKCVGVALSTAFPGGCGSAANFSACLDPRVECRVCRMLNALDGISADCDLFDDGIDNASCP